MRKLVKQFVFAVKTNLILNVDNRVGGGGARCRWQPGGPGFESCWRCLATELWQFRLVAHNESY